MHFNVHIIFLKKGESSSGTLQMVKHTSACIIGNVYYHSLNEKLWMGRAAIKTNEEKKMCVRLLKPVTWRIITTIHCNILYKQVKCSQVLLKRKPFHETKGF